MAVIANIVVLLVPIIFPVLLILISSVLYQLRDYHSLARRLILGGTI